jgi:hypothetical protein
VGEQTPFVEKASEDGKRNMTQGQSSWIRKKWNGSWGGSDRGGDMLERFASCSSIRLVYSMLVIAGVGVDIPTR